MVYCSLIAVVALGTGAVLLTMKALNEARGWMLLGAMFIPGLLWWGFAMMLLLLHDARVTYLRRRNTYIRFLKVPVEECQESLRSALDAMGLAFERERVDTVVDRLPIGGTAEVYRYRPEGAGFKVFLEHYGPVKGEPDREHCLMLVGPIVPSEHGRILALIQTLASMEEKEPPSLVVYGRARDQGPSRRSGPDERP